MNVGSDALSSSLIIPVIVMAMFIILVVVIEHYKSKEWKSFGYNIVVIVSAGSFMVKLLEIVANSNIIYGSSIPFVLIPTAAFCLLAAMSLVFCYFAKPVLRKSLTYQDVLQTIYDIGKEIERHPRTYTEKGEEDLRDDLILGFKGTAFAEAINKKGKTDILIRSENRNICIGECKCWRGKKRYLDGITQLLRNLTWRDSQTALIVFIGNKNFSPVLRIIERETPNHPNYSRFINKRNKSWFNYIFQVEGDPNLKIELAVLLFHTPDSCK